MANDTGFYSLPQQRGNSHFSVHIILQLKQKENVGDVKVVHFVHWLMRNNDSSAHMIVT